MADTELDSVEWELVRADIALEKARLKANGDWAKWEQFQAQNDARWLAYSGSAERVAREARRAGAETEDNRFALWWAVRTLGFSFLLAPPHRRR